MELFSAKSFRGQMWCRSAVVKPTMWSTTRRREEKGCHNMSQHIYIYIDIYIYMSCLFKVCLRGSLVFHKIIYP